MIRCLLTAASALLLALWSPLALAQGAALKMSPGLWEHGFTMKSQGGQMEQALKEMQQSLASMPPEQRRQMEAMLAQQGMSLGPKGQSVKVCLSREDVERDQPPPPQDGCTQTARRSGNVWNLSFRCPGPPPSSGEGRLTLQSPTAYSGSFDLVTTVEGKPEKLQMDVTGKWLASDCGTVRPARR